MIINKTNGLTTLDIENQKLPSYDEIGYSSIDEKIVHTPIKVRKKSEFVTFSFTKNRTEQFKYEALDQDKEIAYKFLSKPDVYVTTDQNNFKVVQLTDNIDTSKSKKSSRLIISSDYETVNLKLTFSIHKSLLSKTKYLISIQNIYNDVDVGNFVWVKPARGAPSVDIMHLIDCKEDKTIAKFCSRIFGLGFGDIVFLKVLPKYQIEIFTTVLAYILENSFI